MNANTEMLIQAYAEDAGIAPAFVRESLQHDPNGSGLYRGFDEFRRGFNRGLAMSGLSAGLLIDAANMIENLSNGDDAYYTREVMDKMMADLRSVGADPT